MDTEEVWTPTHKGVATTAGREYALKCLAWRRANKPEKIDNGSLYAGSPMYFYCHACGHVSDVLPEDYITGPTHICDECAALKQFGWLE